jgi:uncharacterized protein
MRVKKAQIEFFKNAIESTLPYASVFIFGSRVFDDCKGGDIDILVLGERQLTAKEKREIRIAFYKKFGEQKIDIVSFRQDESSTFKEIAMLEAVQI